jgi:hypothetical protein
LPAFWRYLGTRIAASQHSYAFTVCSASNIPHTIYHMVCHYVTPSSMTGRLRLRVGGVSVTVGYKTSTYAVII